MQDGGIQSVQRSFAVLEALARRQDGASIKELCDELRLPKSTVHRLLANLAGLGYISQNATTQRYRATLRLFELGSSVMAHTDVVNLAKEHLERLSAETGEAVHLVVPDGLDIVYVYKADSGRMQMSSRVGLRRPMYCTGVGKAVLSTYPYGEVRRIWQQSEIVPLTPKTILEFAELEKQLAEAKRSGWAVDDEENELGIRCVAVPLAGPGGRANAAFSVTGLAAQMDEKRMGELVRRCLVVRDAILNELGVKPNGL